MAKFFDRVEHIDLAVYLPQTVFLMVAISSFMSGCWIVGILSLAVFIAWEILLLPLLKRSLRRGKRSSGPAQ